jgi:hypothetical protein
MPTSTAALVGLLTAAGTTALTVQGVRRLMSRSIGSEAQSGPPPQPRAMPDPDAAPARGRPARPDGVCAGCGTAIPGGDTLCAICDRQGTGAPGSAWTTVLHWAVFLAGTAAIIGAGALLSP